MTDTIPGARNQPTGDAYYAARKDGSIVPARLRSWGRPSPLHTADRKGSALPPDPCREGRAAAPPRTLPRAVRFRLECRLFYAPHTNLVRANQEKRSLSRVDRPAARCPSHYSNTHGHNYTSIRLVTSSAEKRGAQRVGNVHRNIGCVHGPQ